MEYKGRASRRKPKKKIDYKKVAVIASAILMVLTITSGFFYSQKKNQAVLASNKEIKIPKKEEGTSTLTGVFIDDQQVFLNPKVSMEELSQLRTEVDQLENGDQKNKQLQLIETASDKRYLLTALTNLYQNPVRTDGTIDDQAKLKPEESEESLNKLKKVVEKNQNKDAFYQQVWKLLIQKVGSSAEATKETEETWFTVEE